MGTPVTAKPLGDSASLQVPDAAEAALEADLAKVRFFGTPDALVAGAAEALASCSRVAVVIAAPTSGWSVISNYMQLAADLANKYKTGSGSVGGQHKFRILILVGHRFDIIAKVLEKARVLFKTSTAFVTVLQRRAGQTWTRRPSYAVTLAEKADCTSPVPTVIQVQGTAWRQLLVQESLALRCNRDECRMCDARAAEPEIDADDRDATSLELWHAEEGVLGEEGAGVFLDFSCRAPGPATSDPARQIAGGYINGRQNPSPKKPFRGGFLFCTPGH
jgi:hypothetical protein